MSGTVHVDHTVLAGAAAAMADVASGWGGARTAAADGADAVSTGAGELGGSLLDGVHAFARSWDTVLEVLGQSSTVAGAAMTTVSATTRGIDLRLGS